MTSHKDFVAIADKFFDAGRHNEGCKVLRQAVRLRYSHVASTIVLARALSARGLFVECAALLDLVPRGDITVEALCLKGRSAFMTGRVEAAEQALIAALSDDPNAVDALVGRAVIGRMQGRDDEALAFLSKALEVAPDHARALGLQGLVAMEDGDLETFEACFASARTSTSSDPYLEHSYATALLRNGHWVRGWQAYRQRESYRAPYVLRNHRAPATLADCAGKKICLFIEQGFGDIIQFFRYVAVLCDVGATVHIKCHNRLHHLLASSGFDITITDQIKAASSFDYAMPLFDIPCLLDWSQTPPFYPEPYLRAAPARVTDWAPRLQGPGPKIALAWQGNPNTAVDIGRSIPFAQIAAWVGSLDAQFFAIQKGDAEDAMHADNLPKNLHFLDGLDAGPDAFADTAAVMQNVDLVLSTDTSVAHVAGATGVRSAVMLQARSDWRWGIDTDQSAWYPTMQLLRQSTIGNWGTVLDNAAMLISNLDQKG